MRFKFSFSDPFCLIALFVLPLPQVCDQDAALLS